MKEVNAYLTFDGNCREAMKFYEQCLGAELELTTFGDMPGEVSAAAKDRIMHARLAKGSTILMASDTMPGMPLNKGNNCSIAVHCESRQEIERLFTAFSKNAQIRMPLEDTNWGAHFGMLTDQYGIQWMFNYSKPK